MINAKVIWIPHDKGGRKTIPLGGEYFAVAKFMEDLDWQHTAWSVVFELSLPLYEQSKRISYGTVRFLVDTAPKERLRQGQKFEIYEGARKVADVLL